MMNEIPLDLVWHKLRKMAAAQFWAEFEMRGYERPEFDEKMLAKLTPEQRAELIGQEEQKAIRAMKPHHQSECFAAMEKRAQALFNEYNLQTHPELGNDTISANAGTADCPF